LAGGATPSGEQLLELLAALRGVLAGELRRRGLWSLPPERLGVCGHRRWTEPAAGPLAGALGELTADCYLYVFVRRLSRLAAQLPVKDNVDGLIFLNVRHFVHELQRRHDPLGYRIFRVVRTAVCDLCAGGTLRVGAGPPAIANDTLLVFVPGLPPPAEATRVARAVRGWVDGLLPQLVTATGRQMPPLRTALAMRLAELPGAGIAAFRFRHLIAPLKDETRRRWAALAADPGGSAAAFRRPPPATVEERLASRQGYRRLRSGVTAGIESLAAPPATVRDLRRLWRYLGEHAEGRAAGGSRLPSQRALSIALGIPRGRLPRLFHTLRGLVREVARTA